MTGSKSSINDWSSYLNNDRNEADKFINKYFGNATFYTELYKHFGNKDDAPKINSALYKMANNKDEKIHVALFDIMPLILKFFLINSHQMNKSKKRNDDIIMHYYSCLVSLYNLFRDQISAKTLHVDAYSKGSIYHGQIVKPEASFLHSSIDVENQSDNKVNLSIGQIIERLLQLYVDWIHKFSKASLNEYCILTIRICSLSDNPRLYVPQTTLKCLLNGIYYILFRETSVSSTMHALKALEMRSGYEMMTEVMLTVASIQNSLYSNPSGQPLQGPIGICHFIKERKETLNSDNIITNASFKPEKISEDIISVEATGPETLSYQNSQTHTSNTTIMTTSTGFKLMLNDKSSFSKPPKNRKIYNMINESPLAASPKSPDKHVVHKKRSHNQRHFDDRQNNNDSELKMSHIQISTPDSNNNENLVNDDSYDSSVHSETNTPQKLNPKILSTEM